MDVNAIPATALPQVDPRVPAPLRAKQPAGNTPAQARKVAQEFEAMFVGMMLKSMRDTVPQNKLTGGGHGEETFRSLLDQEYAQTAAKSGGVGLAPVLEKEFLRATAVTPPARGGADAD